MYEKRNLCPVPHGEEIGKKKREPQTELPLYRISVDESENAEG